MSFMKLILKTQTSSRIVDEKGIVYVNDDEEKEDDCFKPSDLTNISMVEWMEEF